MEVLVGRVEGIAAAAALGLVHRHVGSPQEHVGLVAVLGIASHADAGIDVDGVAEQLDGLAESFEDLFRGGLEGLALQDGAEADPLWCLPILPDAKDALAHRRQGLFHA